jgi:hypothetical protein
MAPKAWPYAKYGAALGIGFSLIRPDLRTYAFPYVELAIATWGAYNLLDTAVKDRTGLDIYRLMAAKATRLFGPA